MPHAAWRVRQRFPRGCRRHLLHDGSGFIPRQNPLPRRFSGQRLDALHPRGNEFLVDVLQDNRDAVDREQLRDARTHHSGAEHCDTLDSPWVNVIGNPRRALPRPLALQEHLD